MADADSSAAGAGESPELDHNAIGFRGALVIGLASTAPAYSLAAVIGTVTVIVGFQAPGALLASFVPMFLIAAAFFYMNRADQDAGTTFSWVTRAMGPWLGWIGGWAICTTGILVVGSLADVGARYTYELFGWDDAAGSKAAVMALAVFYIVAMTAICIRGTELAASRPGRPDRASGRRAAPLRRLRPREGLHGRRAGRLVEAGARLVLAVRVLGLLVAGIGAPDRRVHLLGLGERRQPDRGDARLASRTRAGGRGQHGDPARHLRRRHHRGGRVRRARDARRVRRRRRDLRRARRRRARVALGQARHPRDPHLRDRLDADHDHPRVAHVVLDGAPVGAAAPVRGDPPALPHALVLDRGDRRLSRSSGTCRSTRCPRTFSSTRSRRSR